MAEAGNGQGSDPNESTGQGNDPNHEPTNAPYKVFETEEDFKKSQSKFFSGAYNEGMNKAVKDAKNVFGVDIDDFENTEDFFTEVKNRIASNPSSEDESEDNSEVEELRSKLQEAREEAEAAKEGLSNYKTQQKINESLSEALSSVKQNFKQLTVNENHLKRLFKDENTVKVDDDGNTYIERNDGTPVLDGDGNRQDVSSVFSSFVKEYNYATPIAEGSQGGTGGGSNSNKPSKSKWKELIKSNSQGATKKAAEMYNTAKETGWAE